MSDFLHMTMSAVAGAWQVAAAMAPYLLLGFAVAGLLHVLIPASWVVRHLGGRGWKPAVKSALAGVPLPLCSCSVIPVAATLRSQGAGRGAVAAFLMSTPQTGVDSIAVTYGLLGPVLAVVRPVVAFVSGALCGVVVDRWGGEDSTGAAADGTAAAAATPGPAWRRALRHGFVTLPRSIGREVLVGLLLAGILGSIVPHDFFADRLRPGLPAMLAMLAIGIPMYVCSTASVPIALGLINAGISPGAALVFLVTGPATNAATLMAMTKMLGRRPVAIYLLCLVAAALASGWLLDRWLVPAFPGAAPLCHVEPPGPWGHAMAAALLAVLLIPQWRRRKPEPAAGAKCSCCAGRAAPAGAPAADDQRR